MANTYTQLLYHVVFSTKNRVPAITEGRRNDLYAYLWGIHKTLKCHVYRIGGVADHVHIATSIPTTLTISRYIEQIKSGSSGWVNEEQVFPEWQGWQDGYGAFTVSWTAKNSLIEYIKTQEQHHRAVTFEEEYEALMKKMGIDYDPKYLF